MAPTARSRAFALKRKRDHVRDLGGVQIFVKTPTGETITLDGLELDERISNIKAKIQDMEHIPLDQQVLHCRRCHHGPDGKGLLLDRNTLANYGLRDGDTLELFTRTQIFVKTAPGKTITLDVDGNYTIGEVKLEISRRAKVGTHYQRLLFEGGPLDDDDTTLYTHGIDHGGELVLLACVPFFVVTAAGKRFPLTLWNDTTIDKVKAEIQKQEGIPIDQQILTFRSEQLEGGATLYACNINFGDEMLLV